MGKLAIDIVLLPPEEIMKLAKVMNKKLLDKYDGEIDFVNEICIPHLTLCMGGIKKEDVPKLSNIVTEISKKFAPINLTITGNGTYISPDGSKGFGLMIKKDRTLYKLHEKILHRCEALFVKVTAEHVNPPGKIRASSIKHANKFVEMDGFELFNPHITLGVGETKSINERVNFTAKRLAICHLGNWCTCRKILFETELRGKE